MRGVHPGVTVTEQPDKGSSPHARGPPSSTTVSPARLRFIPACAGSTSISIVLPHTFQVHPRMRGVHQFPHPTTMLIVGSSPHARGPPPSGSSMGGGVRFIPACAGSTFRPAKSIQGGGVHPRMRGVHLSWVGCSDLAAGSSPHARGPRSTTPADTPIPRFIPACAGSTYGISTPA